MLSMFSGKLPDNIQTGSCYLGIVLCVYCLLGSAFYHRYSIHKWFMLNPAIVGKRYAVGLSIVLLLVIGALSIESEHIASRIAKKLAYMKTELGGLQSNVQKNSE